MACELDPEWVEDAAKALYETEWKRFPKYTWAGLDASEREYWHESARAALSAVVAKIEERVRREVVMEELARLGQEIMPEAYRHPGKGDRR